MRNKLRPYLMLGLAINTLLFSGYTQAAVVRLSSLKLTVNDVGVGIDSSKDKRIFVPLGDGFSKNAKFDATLKYNPTNKGYVFKLGQTSVKNGAKYSFPAMKYGYTQPILLYQGNTLVDTYTLVFTNLPVVQMTTPLGLTDGSPKGQGTFRLLSGSPKKDTGTLSIGVDYAGRTGLADRQYNKKPYSIELGTSHQFWQKSKAVALLDLSEKSSWLLEAPYRDKLASRAPANDDIFSTIKPKNIGLPNGRSVGRSRVVEAIINGNYAGAYLLKEPVDQKLLDLKATSGSVLYRADFGDQVFFKSTAAQIATNFSMQYPAAANATNWKPLVDFVDFVATSNNATFSKTIKNRIDLNSVAHWWLLVSATQAIDNFNKGFFIGQNAGGKFFMAPSNHEASFGLGWDGSADLATTFFDASGNNLIKRLLENPSTGFNTILKDRWLELRDPGQVFDKAKLMSRIKSLANKYAVGGAQKRNDAIWPKSTLPAVIANPKAGTVGYIDTFLDTRLNAMDAYIDGLPE